jgi:hypothetical protein
MKREDKAGEPLRGFHSQVTNLFLPTSFWSEWSPRPRQTVKELENAHDFLVDAKCFCHT